MGGVSAGAECGCAAGGGCGHTLPVGGTTALHSSSASAAPCGVPVVCLCLTPQFACVSPHRMLCVAQSLCGGVCVCVFVSPSVCVFALQERGVGGGFLVLTLACYMCQHLAGSLIPPHYIVVHASLFTLTLSNLPCVRHTALLLHSTSTLAGASACCQHHMGSGWESCLMAACGAGWQVGRLAAASTLWYSNSSTQVYVTTCPTALMGVGPPLMGDC